MMLPLANLRVLDVSQIMAGPYCCMLLGDMGADVIKVEAPGSGDQTRRAMGFRLKGDDSGGFLALNRNKRSVEIDLKHPEGREAFYELVRQADILVENNRPGVAARLQIDFDTLHAINPRLVYASISGFGQTGPWSRRPGLDLIAQASCGAMSVMGEPGGAPMKSSVPFADLGAALFASYAILSAVIGRASTGLGQYIDASLYETALGLSVWESAEFWGTGRVPAPLGSANRMSAPYQAVRAADRYMVIGAANDKLWIALCGVIGRPDLPADPRFMDNVARLSHRAELIPLIEEALAAAPADVWVERLLAAGVPAAPILDYGEALDTEQARAREMVLEIDHPVEGPTRTLGFPVKLRGTPQQVRRPAPLLGQHTEEVFQELGIDAQRVARWREAGAFGAARSPAMA
ncbi:CaiB/BaiF CoA transferase family protein [Pseudomonadota bacterium AL_CKDN230030165-1A_HGKHYDSX7]